MPTLRFTKMHGLGNDFMVIDAIHQSVQLSQEDIRRLADRHRGVGFDQLLLLEKASNPSADFGYRIFNADGGEVAQCGNGARCLARFIRDKGFTHKNPITVETGAGLMVLTQEPDGQVTVNMGVPNFDPPEVPFQPSDSGTHPLHTLTVTHTGDAAQGVVLSLGNPHFVIRVNEMKGAPVVSLGAHLTSHPQFPEGANVGFMEVKDPHHIALRVYERGAGETQACGSGACAAAVAGIHQGWLETPVEVVLEGGSLTIGWEGEGKPVYMTGPAASVFEGKIDTVDKFVE